jgi:hypothetical protein
VDEHAGAEGQEPTGNRKADAGAAACAGDDGRTAAQW